MNSKGVGVSQVFIYIIAAITFAVIMIFGYNAITDFIEKGEQVQFIEFSNKLQSDIVRLYSEYGSVREFSYTPPTKHTQICFVNLDYTELNKEDEIQRLCQKDPVACEVWLTADSSADADQNVFLVPPGFAKIKVSAIETEEGTGFFCEDVVEGSFTIRLEGLGDRTRVGKALE